MAGGVESLKDMREYLDNQLVEIQSQYNKAESRLRSLEKEKENLLSNLIFLRGKYDAVAETKEKLLSTDAPESAPQDE